MTTIYRMYASSSVEYPRFHAIEITVDGQRIAMQHYMPPEQIYRSIENATPWYEVMYHRLLGRDIVQEKYEQTMSLMPGIYQLSVQAVFAVEDVDAIRARVYGRDDSKPVDVRVVPIGELDNSKG